MASRAEKLANHTNGKSGSAAVAVPSSPAAGNGPGPGPEAVPAGPETGPRQVGPESVVVEAGNGPAPPRSSGTATAEVRVRPLAERLGLVRPPAYATHTPEERLKMEAIRKEQREQRAKSAPVRAVKQAAEDQKAIDDAENNLVAALRRVVHGEDAPLDKRNHLTLVELRYLMQLGRVPRAAWEPIAFLYMEGVKFRKWGFSFQRHYIESLLLTSQSVDGYRSDQLTRSLISEQTAKNNAAAGLRSPSGNQGDPGAGRP